MPTPPPPPVDPTLERTVEQVLHKGIEYHRAGLLEYAEQLYRSILQVLPDHAEANHSLGVLEIQRGHPEAALEYLTGACAAKPETGQYWISVAECLLRLDRKQDAIEVLQTAIHAGLDHPQAHSLLQQAQQALVTLADPAHENPTAEARLRHREPATQADAGLLDEIRALVRKSRHRASIRRAHRRDTDLPADVQAALNAADWRCLEVAARHALSSDPLLGKAWGLLGMVYLQIDNNPAALIALTRAAELRPEDPVIHDHLGIAQRQAAHYEAAERSFKRSLAIEPLRAETWVNLGNLQRDQARPEQAIDSFQRALALDPTLFAAQGNLGNALRDAGRYAEAVSSLRQALEINPRSAETHCNLGNALKDIGLFDEAIASYRQAIGLRPDFAEAYSGLARTLIDCNQTDAAIDNCRRAIEIKPDFFDARSNLLSAIYGSAKTSASEALEEARRYGERVTLRANVRPHTTRITAPPKVLRVGLVSGDLREHPVGFFIEGLMREIDPARVELFAFHCSAKEDALSARLRPLFSAWTSLLGLSDEAAARQVRSHNLHLLIDLAGHTALNRLPLFGWKPAPVQASWLGYYATTGVAEMDFLLGDPHVTPADEETHFTEAIWRLPESYLCFTAPDVVLDPGPLPALNRGGVTFGCFNNLNKMNDAVVALWARVLLAVPGSRLFLKTRRLSEPAERTATCRRFAAHGIAADRLLLEGASPRAELLAAYQRVDIALDPFPYPGGTTSVESLWMGVPVLTRRGDRFLSHIGESIARNAGLADWIANDDDDYVRIAATRAQDLPKLAALRAGLRRQVLASPLFDAPRFARHFESALWGMWQARGAHR